MFDYMLEKHEGLREELAGEGLTTKDLLFIKEAIRGPSPSPTHPSGLPPLWSTKIKVQTKFLSFHLNFDLNTTDTIMEL